MTSGAKPLTLWIINQYASTPKTGMGGRSFYLGRELARRGHKVSLIAGSFSHLLRTPPTVKNPARIEIIDGVSMVWIRLPKYGTAHSYGRAVNWFLFALNLIKEAKHITPKPDVIIFSSPPLLSWLSAEYLARKYQSKLCFEVRDIWPLTLIEIGGYNTRNPLIQLLQYIEDRAYRNSDIVISNLKHANLHMAERGVDQHKFHWLPNGFDNSEFAPVLRTVPKTISDLPENSFVVGYVGTIGEANALDTLIKTAVLLANNPKIHFAIVGRGRLKQQLISAVVDRSLSNVTFVDAVPKDTVPAVLARFDACYIGARKSPLYRFGVAMNKIPEYLRSAKPLIYAIDSGEYRPVRDAQCGIEVAPEDPDQLASAIIDLSNITVEERNAMGRRGREYAESLFDYRNIAKELEYFIS